MSTSNDADSLSADGLVTSLQDKLTVDASAVGMQWGLMALLSVSEHL
jgi:hypothetical protein